VGTVHVPAFAVPEPERVAMILSGAVFFAVELNQGRNRRADALSADRGSRMVLRLAYLAGFAVAVAIIRSTGSGRIDPAGAAGAVGLVLFWCGIGLRLWSFRTLGRYFTFTVQTSADQPVISTGPYRVLRHPSYAAIVLAVVGIGLFLDNWWALVTVVAATVAGLSYRIHVEEQALVRQLGETYRAYASTRKRLVPFVW
jgi:protein-S-isoprenylcysteine O-methyltransferase Ste14